MKRRLLLPLVVVTCLAVATLPVTAQPAQGRAAPAWFDALSTWLQTGIQQVMGLVTEAPPAAPTGDPPPLSPLDDLGPDPSGTDSGTESSPEMDPDG